MGSEFVVWSCDTLCGTLNKVPQLRATKSESLDACLCHEHLQAFTIAGFFLIKVASKAIKLVNLSSWSSSKKDEGVSIHDQI